MTPSFFKYAFKATPKSRATTMAQRHFDSPDPNWKQFEKNLKLKSFQQVVAGHPQADAKLKTYVDNFGGYLLSKKVTAKVVGDSGKTYTVKELPGGRLGCSCKNWQYRRSVDGGDCKHITSIVEPGMKRPLVKKSDMVKLSLAKQAFMKDLINAGGTLALNNRRLNKNLDRARLSKATSDAYGSSLYDEKT